MGLSHAKCTSTARLDGKIALVTGSNTGIGKITALELFKRGAHVIMACRNLEKANAAAEEIFEICENNENLGKLEITELNLCSLVSVRKCASKLLENQPRIDLLINNAGIMCCPYAKTEDGYEIQFGTNHLGHFLFTLLLLPKIIQSAPARIINVSSIAHTKAKIENVKVYSLHPGVIATELGRHLDDTYFPGLRWIWRTIAIWFIKTPEQGAQTTLHCAVDENAGKETGLYYAECKPTEPSLRAQNMEDAEKLWNISLEMSGLQRSYNPFKI